MTDKRRQNQQYYPQQKKHTMPSKETKRQPATPKRPTAKLNQHFLANSRAAALQQTKLHVAKLAAEN